MLQVHYEVDAPAGAPLQGGPESNGSSTGWGLWAGGGAYYKLRGSWLLGADARWEWVPVGISGARANAGGLQVSVSAGYRWAEW